MIPVSLHLTNFLSWRRMEDPLCFTGMSLACLSGANGHGKSSLLDAMTWALWGRGRGATGGHDQDRLISDGADAARVVFVFSLDGQDYRVSRERWRSGKSSLEFAVAAPDGGWTDLTGEGIADTQRRIESRLRMDYETFVASAFILQGRADTFSTLDPAQRKEVLGKILGIEVYERFTERARERKKECAEQGAASQGEIDALERDLSALSGAPLERDGAASAAAEASDRLGAAQVGHGEALAAVGRLQELAAAAEEVRKRAAAAAMAAAAAHEEIARADADIAGLRLKAALEREVEALAEQRPSLAARLGVLDRARDVHQALVEEAKDLAARISEERVRLEGERSKWQERISKLRLELQAEPALRAKLAAAQADREALERTAVEREEILDAISSGKTRIPEIDTLAQTRALTAEQIREKLDLLGVAEAACPVCGEKLTSQHRDEIRGELEAELSWLNLANEQSAVERKGVSAQLKELQSRAERSAHALERRADLARTAGRLEEALEALGRAAAELSTAHDEGRRVAEELRAETYSPTERDKLATVRREIDRVAFDADERTTVERAHHEALEAERALSLALQARASRSASEAGRLAAQGRLDSATEAHAAAERQLSEMGERLQGFDVARDALVKAQAELDSAAGDERGARERLAVAEERVAALEAKSRLAEQARARLADAKMRAKLFDKLVKAFGRDGIPARIIGNAIPELRIEANRLLELLSDGQLTISIDPVKQTKSGRDRETLDITVYDSTGGKRAYEMYSGGERLRIDVALRVALSRLLTRRAGARLETLVLDEGFGSQDSQGRARLVEAIHRIRNDFALIVVMTHLEELKDQFPVRIEVEKDPVLGSRAAVV